MVLAGIIGASGWFYLANFAQTPFEATAASVVASLGVAVSDVVADSIVVEKVRRPMVLETLDAGTAPIFHVSCLRLGSKTSRLACAPSGAMSYPLLGAIPVLHRSAPLYSHNHRARY